MAMGKADESLRSTRLVFYKEDIEKIAKVLNTFLKNANARCVLLVDKTTLGLVRLYASQVSSKLGELFHDIAERKSEGEKISQEFGQAAKGKLDGIFGS